MCEWAITSLSGVSIAKCLGNAVYNPGESAIQFTYCPYCGES